MVLVLTYAASVLGAPAPNDPIALEGGEAVKPLDEEDAEARCGDGKRTHGEECEDGNDEIGASKLELEN